MRALSTYVDSLVDSGDAQVSESVLPAVSVHGLRTDHAIRLLELLNEIGLTARIIDSAEQPIDGREDLNAGLAPFSAFFTKPENEDILFLSQRAFLRWLAVPTAALFVRVASATCRFVTEAFTVTDWDDAAPASLRNPRKSPRRVVRDASGRSLVPVDIRPYLLTDDADDCWRDSVFRLWAAHAASQLVVALATEALPNDRVDFVGPPRLNLNSILPGDSYPSLRQWFGPLQEVAAWVYDVDRETELRHRLFAQEFARLAYGAATTDAAFAKSGLAALEGAKIAYGFHVQDVSKDALKSLADLRKSVTEDTQKLFESMRQVVLGAAAALFYVLGLVATKLSSTLDPNIFVALLLVGFIYVSAVVVVSFRGIRQQRELRSIWRTKVYRYLTEDDYKEMVTAPLERAENLFGCVLWCIVAVAALAFVWASWFIR